MSSAYDPHEFRTTLSAPGSTLTAYGVLALLSVWWIIRHLNSADLSPLDFAWNTFVYVIPSRLITLLDTVFENYNIGDHKVSISGFNSQHHAEKSNAMRRILGFEAPKLTGVIERTRTFSQLGGMLKSRPSNLPPGLGNWDNSCYQNSILQGLASVDSMREFLDRTADEESENTTSSTLKDLIVMLNDGENNGRTFWSPARLKNMSSWQQQDAQEYFSKVLDEVEKDVIKNLKKKTRAMGFQEIPKTQKSGAGLTEDDSFPSLSYRMQELPHEVREIITKSPLEGLLAQRVGCQRCGYVEGLSLVPFNCLTLPLPQIGGLSNEYDISACLDAYTSLELITGVECVKCTLLQAEKQMVALLETLQALPPNTTDARASERAASLCESVTKQLQVAQQALETEDFSENILKKCDIGPKNRVTTTKSRQAVVARAPKALALHVNRSKFNELTGVQSKNYAPVKFPQQLRLHPWCLGPAANTSSSADNTEQWKTNPSESLLSQSETAGRSANMQYKLRAVITHYGRHENGHYICYRKSPSNQADEKPKIQEGEEASPWFKLSDEDVTEVSEETVLAQGGVFMLFYEQLPSGIPQPVFAGGSAASIDNVSLVEDTVHAMDRMNLDPQSVPFAASENSISKESKQVEDSAATPGAQSQSPPTPDEALPETEKECPSPPAVDAMPDDLQKALPDTTSIPTPPSTPPISASMARTNQLVPRISPRSGRGDSDRATSTMETVAGFVQAN